MSKKTWLGYGLLITACVLFSVLAEGVWFHRNVWLHGVYERELALSGDVSEGVVKVETAGGRERLSAEEENAVLVARENARILAELNGQDQAPGEEDGLIETEEGMYRSVWRTKIAVTLPEAVYVGTIRLSCPETAEGSRVEIYGEGGESPGLLNDSYMDGRLHAGVYRVDSMLKDFHIIITNREHIPAERIGLHISNASVWNPVRMCFLAAAAFLTGFLLLYGKGIGERPENAFAAASLLLGGLLIYAVGTNQIGYDEHVHMKQAYDLSFGSTVLTTGSAMQMEAASFPSFYSLEERKLAEQYAESNHDYSWANITYQSRFAGYDVRSYFPIAAGFWLGRVLKLPFAWMLMLGKFCNLLAYMGVCYLAVRFAKQGKALVCALALMPNCLFAAAGITYDGVVNGFLLLACVLTMNAILDRDGRITPAGTFALLGAYVAGSTAKPIYVLMAFMLVFLPGRKFSGRGREAVFKAAVVALGILMLYSFFFPPVSASSNYEVMGNLAYAGDRRTQGSSVLGQLGYMKSHPFVYMGLLFSSMAGELYAYLTGGRQFINYGYLGGLSVFWTWLGLAALLLAALCAPQGETRRGIGGKYIALNLLMVFGMSAVIWTSMYVTFTAVGSSTIEGVQGRYFIPLFFPFFSCLFQGRWKIPVSRSIYTKIIFGVMLAINLYAVWSLAAPRNL